MSKIDSFQPGKSKFWRLRNDARMTPQPWRWPLQTFGDRPPVVLAHAIVGKHGVDLGYEARPNDAELCVPVYAAQDGEVMFCGETTSAFSISIDHKREGWATYYGHLSKVCVAQNLTQINRRRQRVQGGDVIGYAARSPVHLRFALWRWTDDRGFVAVPPLQKFNEWASPLSRIAETPTKKAA